MIVGRDGRGADVEGVKFWKGEKEKRLRSAVTFGRNKVDGETYCAFAEP